MTPPTPTAMQQQHQAFAIVDPPTTDDKSEDEMEAEEKDRDSDTAIGTALKSGRYKCNVLRCARKTFSRPAELRRHYDTVHIVKRQFWCLVQSCERSVSAGGKPFPRQDKLRDHVRSMHIHAAGVRSSFGASHGQHTANEN